MPPPGYEPFLHAICANPGDETARLVYADWLDENGDPDRAESIRLTIAMRHDPPPDARPDPRRARVQELMDRHCDAWTAELPGPASLWWIEPWWHAGFPALVSVAGDGQFLRHADEIVRRTPARHLALEHPCDAAALLAELGACPAVAHFRALCSPKPRVRDVGAEALARGPHFAGLTFLQLYRSGIGDAGALALARSPYLGNLAFLDLEANPIGPAGAEALRARFGDRVNLTPPQ